MKDAESKEVHPSPEGVPEGIGSGTGTWRRRNNPTMALYREAVAGFRRLKREHRLYFREEPKTFRATVRQAERRVFRLKPGPKTVHDPRIAKAARARSLGASWPKLYPDFIEGYQTMTEYTRSFAEEGFRKKVNVYLRCHPRLKSQRAIKPNDSRVEL